MIKFSLFTFITALLFYACSYKPVEDTGKGRKFYSNVNYDSLHQKIIYFTNVLIQHPEDPNILFQRSKTYRKLSEYNLALNDINEAIKYDPEFKESYYERGVLYNALNQYEDAIMDFNLLLKSDSNHVGANTEIGFSYAKLEKYEIAKKHLDKSIILDTLRYDPYYYRGVCNFNTSNYIFALSDFNKAIELNKDFAYNYSTRSKTYLVLRRFYESFSDINKAIELDPENLEFVSDKDYVNEQINSLEKLENEIREYSAMITSGESDPETYFNRGMSYFGLLEYIPGTKDDIWKNIENDMKKYIELAPTGKNSEFANKFLPARESKKDK